MNIKGCLLHNSDNWKTPSNIYDRIIKLGFIDTFKYQSNNDEFLNMYKEEKLFCNPPYSKLNDAIDWIIKQFKNQNDLIVLIPARTDTKYFHKLLDNVICDIYFIKGRLHFNDTEKVAPFPSLFIHISDFCNSNFYWCDIDEFLFKMGTYYE